MYTIPRENGVRIASIILYRILKWQLEVIVVYFLTTYHTAYGGEVFGSFSIFSLEIEYIFDPRASNMNPHVGIKLFHPH